MWTANLAVFAVGFSFIVAYTLVPLIGGYPEQVGYGLALSTTQIALVLTPAGLAALVGGLLAGRIAGRLGPRNLALTVAGCAAVTYVALLAGDWSVGLLVVAMVPLGLGLTLSLSAILDLVVISSATAETGVTIALNNVIRSIGSVLGAGVAIAVVTATPGLAPGLPAEAGFTHGFELAAAATAVAIAAIALIPARAGVRALEPAGASTPAG